MAMPIIYINNSPKFPSHHFTMLPVTCTSEILTVAHVPEQE